MKNYLLNLDVTLLKMVRAIGREADRKKFSAYIVGGIVRDLILKRKNYDLDIVVEGDAISLARVLARKWKSKLTVHDQFGTATLKTPKGVSVDFAMARQERYMQPGSLPVVHRGKLREDMFRRDFTINTMAIAINPGRFGDLIDEFNGLSDLSRKVIRIMHKWSFIDDPTRILRAVRFEQRLDFRMEQQTFLLMRSAISKRALSTVNPSRSYAELKKTLRENNPVKCVKRLSQLKALRFIDPKLKIDVRALEQLHRNIETIRKRTIYNSENWRLIYLMGILSKAGDPVYERISARFPFTKGERKSLQQIRKSDSLLKQLNGSKLKPSESFQVLRPLTQESILYLRVSSNLMAVNRRIDRLLMYDRCVKLDITGDDLKKLGYKSGDRIGTALDNILFLKIDKRIKTGQDEIKQALLLLE